MQASRLSMSCWSGPPRRWRECVIPGEGRRWGLADPAAARLRREAGRRARHPRRRGGRSASLCLGPCGLSRRGRLRPAPRRTHGLDRRAAWRPPRGTESGRPLSWPRIGLHAPEEEGGSGAAKQTPVTNGSSTNGLGTGSGADEPTWGCCERWPSLPDLHEVSLGGWRRASGILHRAGRGAGCTSRGLPQCCPARPALRTRRGPGAQSGQS